MHDYIFDVINLPPHADQFIQTELNLLFSFHVSAICIKQTNNFYICLRKFSSAPWTSKSNILWFLGFHNNKKIRVTIWGIDFSKIQRELYLKGIDWMSAINTIHEFSWDCLIWELIFIIHLLSYVFLPFYQDQTGYLQSKKTYYSHSVLK